MLAWQHPNTVGPLARFALRLVGFCGLAGILTGVACASLPVWDSLGPETGAALRPALIAEAATYVQALISHDWETAHKLQWFNPGDSVSLSEFRARMSGPYEAAIIRVFEIQRITLAPRDPYPSASIMGCAVLQGRREPTVMFFFGALVGERWLFDLPQRTGQLGEREQTCSFARRRLRFGPK
jgi:hypothetical protein